MNPKYPLHAVFYKTDTGKEPVREWLKGLQRNDRKIIGEDYKDNPVWVATWYAIGKKDRCKFMGNQVEIR